MGRGLLMGALGGAARGVTGYAEDEQKKLALEESQQKQIAHERMLMNERADLEVSKTALIEEMRAKRARDAGLKQGSDIQAEVSRLDSEDTGLDAHKKSLGLLTATRQETLEREIKAASNLGYDNVATAKRNELNVERQFQSNEDRTKDANRRMDIQEKFNEGRAEIQDKLAMIQESRANRMEFRSDTQMARAELQSTRQALTSVLGDIGKQEDRLQSIIKDTFDPADKERLQKQMNELDQSRKGARSELMKLAGVDKSAKSDSSKFDAMFPVKAGQGEANRTPNTNSEPKSSSSTTRNGVDMDARKKEIERFNQAVAPRRISNEDRESKMNAVFSEKLDDLSSASSLGDANQAVKWYNENSDSLTQEQRNQFRVMKKQKGIL